MDRWSVDPHRADLVTGDPEGKKSSCYSKLNCEVIPPHVSPRDP
jgi:hypothetical protein